MNLIFFVSKSFYRVLDKIRKKVKIVFVVNTSTYSSLRKKKKKYINNHDYDRYQVCLYASYTFVWIKKEYLYREFMIFRIKLIETCILLNRQRLIHSSLKVPKSIVRSLFLKMPFLPIFQVNLGINYSKIAMITNSKYA